MLVFRKNLWQGAWLGVALLLGVLLTANLNAFTPWQPPTSPAVSRTEPKPWPQTVTTRIGGHPFVLEVAQTPNAIEHGLMERTHLAKHSGMVFVFKGSEFRYFWMKNTLIPLDMLFVAKKNNHVGLITHIVHGAPPCQQVSSTQADCPIYRSPSPITWVIELAGGRAQALGLQSGDSVVFARP